MDTPPISPKYESKKRKFESRYELLECPICFDLPRSGPLFGCKNGHLLCNLCRNTLLKRENETGHCPICRSSDLSCRNLIAEKLLEELLENNKVKFDCRFASEGCNEKGEGHQIEKHEYSCWFRHIECPSTKFGSCAWRGPIKNLVKHVVANKCAQVLKTNALTNQFSSSICDFPANNSVFKRISKTHWKPVLLFSPLTVAFFIYLTICRDKDGLWKISARSYAPRSVSDYLCVQISTFSPSSTHGSFRAFSYTGKVSPHSLSDNEVNSSGEYLLLQDKQVQSLMKDNRLFQYCVKINKAHSKSPLENSVVVAND